MAFISHIFLLVHAFCHPLYTYNCKHTHSRTCWFTGPFPGYLTTSPVCSLNCFGKETSGIKQVLGLQDKPFQSLNQKCWQHWTELKTHYKQKISNSNSQTEMTTKTRQHDEWQTWSRWSWNVCIHCRDVASHTFTVLSDELAHRQTDRLTAVYCHWSLSCYSNYKPQHGQKSFRLTARSTWVCDGLFLSSLHQSPDSWVSRFF